MLFPTTLILVRGAGDLATGVIYRLYQAGFPVIAAEIPQPLAVRRTVAFAQAVYAGAHTVEGVTATRVGEWSAALSLAQQGDLPVLPDPRDEVITRLSPAVVVDARLLKRPDAARIDQAPLVIGLGPGFVAGGNCHAAIETHRGHRLGRVLWRGATDANTGAPGDIMGYNQERVLRAPAAGVFQSHATIGDRVTRKQVVGWIETTGAQIPVFAGLNGVLRGLLHPGLEVSLNAKLGDIDPRDDPEAIHTISDKSLAIGGAVLAAVLAWLNRVTT